MELLRQRVNSQPLREYEPHRLALAIIIVIGVPVGYAMGRWWRVQAYFTDLVTVGWRCPPTCGPSDGHVVRVRHPCACFLCSGLRTPGLIVHVLQGSLSVPRDLRDMSDAFDVAPSARIRHLVLPSMASAIIAGIRLAIIAAWGCVLLVEWFGEQRGGWFQGPALVPIGRQLQRIDGLGNRRSRGCDNRRSGIIERIDKSVHKWRGSVGGFGATKVAGADAKQEG